jgi:N-acetylated-alpha-linked acidic dipeptidase
MECPRRIAGRCVLLVLAASVWTLVAARQQSPAQPANSAPSPQQASPPAPSRQQPLTSQPAAAANLTPNAGANSVPPLLLRGFTAAGSLKETGIERQLNAATSRQEIQEFHRYLTRQPHPAGSQQNNELAQWVAGQWKAQGLEDVTIHEYDVYSSRPKEISLEMITPKTYKAGLREDAYPQDADTTNRHVDGAYFGYSASGEVTAPVIYAHSGNPEDYDLLRKQGISVKDKIVLVRYSNPYSYRGFKAFTAQKEGAAAILIYSDPAEDGYRRGKVFPDGPWGPASHIQRGAITYDFLEPGDPTTPGWASVPGAKHIDPKDAISLPKIIGIPLSWRDAKPLLENMDGPVAPQDWQGALPLIYHFGGDKVTAHLKVEMDNSIQPYYVTEARIHGADWPDQWVVLGNHRDAWVYGGVDPSSGTASMLELTQELGTQLRQGIRPRRTLVFCSWDGEEYALTGSTEWGEQYAEDLKRSAVAYINVDSAASGPYFHGSAVGSLAPLMVEISHGESDPSKKSLYDAWRISRGEELGGTGPAADDKLAEIRIGSGSDHTVFLNFLGIPTVLLQFDGPYGVYHSLYDDYYWINHFGDPGYHYHALMAQLWGATALRLANSDLLPYDYSTYGASISLFLSELDATSHASTHADLPALRRAIEDFTAAGAAVDASVTGALRNQALPAGTLQKLNDELMQVERNWLDPAGIPGRPWFKHTIYAARYTYAHLELPGLTEAAEANNWPLFKAQAALLQRQLETNTDLLHRVNAELQPLQAVPIKH